jgi:hypothetical protein
VATFVPHVVFTTEPVAYTLPLLVQIKNLSKKHLSLTKLSLSILLLTLLGPYGEHLYKLVNLELPNQTQRLNYKVRRLNFRSQNYKEDF